MGRQPSEVILIVRSNGCLNCAWKFPKNSVVSQFRIFSMFRLESSCLSQEQGPWSRPRPEYGKPSLWNGK